MESPMLKIAFSGTHGVGKSTAVRRFATMLADAGFRAEVLEEVARRCPLPVNEAGTGLAQIWITASQVAEEAKFEAAGAEVLIADRSVFDHVAYARWLHRRGRVSDRELKLIEHLAVSWTGVRPYHAIVFFRPLGEPLPDGFRSTNRDFQLGVHEELERLYAELHPKQLVEYKGEPTLKELLASLKQRKSSLEQPSKNCLGTEKFIRHSAYF